MEMRYWPGTSSDLPEVACRSVDGAAWHVYGFGGNARSTYLAANQVSEALGWYRMALVEDDFPDSLIAAANDAANTDINAPRIPW